MIVLKSEQKLLNAVTSFTIKALAKYSLDYRQFHCVLEHIYGIQTAFLINFYLAEDWPNDCEFSCWELS